MTPPPPDAAPAETPKHIALGLTDHEYGLICDGMGREPNEVELAMFSLLWSEHCAYKHSKKLLRRLPTEGPRVVMGPGENAGAVDIGGGWSVAFKVESHNHPSAVEPFQGAATGVGGIMRDVFALGARPIAILDSLRFGELSSERSRFLFEHVVEGIGHYGNSIGVPTIGGEVYFEAPYEQNCLVNAMCIGLAETRAMVRAAAAGVGNKIVLMGATTGRDGIGGASVLASAELEEGDEKRPTVQIGDPFEEKKVMECCLELLDTELLVSLQDLGAAGLTSSASEMASAGGVGLRLEIDKVPKRNPDLEPFEVMVSESQERMLAVVEPDKVDAVLAICEKWETNGNVIGEVTEGNQIKIYDGGEVVGDIPVQLLVDDCPIYDLDPAEPGEWIYGNEHTLETDDPSEILKSLLAAPSIASKRWAFEQYDPIVQSRTVRRSEQADGAVLQIAETGNGICAAIDGNGRRVACDPYTGTIEVVLECAANLACSGAEPLGLTNCLNFGNPEKPTVAWQLDRSTQGLADVCNQLGIPVVGGNVSLYNETEKGPIYPTPTIGLVGEVPDPAVAAAVGVALTEGDTIAWIGSSAPKLAGSELAKQRGELAAGLPEVDVAAAAESIETVRQAVRDGMVRVAHDIGDGGLAVALAEACIAGGVGAEVDLGGLIAAHGGEAEDWMFGETSGGFLIAGDADKIGPVAETSGGAIIGSARGDQVKLLAAGIATSVPVAEAEAAWHSIADRMLAA